MYGIIFWFKKVFKIFFQKVGTAQAIRALKRFKSTQADMIVLPSLEMYFEQISIKLKFGNLRYRNPYGFCL